MKKVTTVKIAVIYARYSSAGQRDVSIEQQVSVCQKYADDNDLQIMRVYDDHAMTGTNDNRPNFQQMISDSGIGAFDYVIVYSLDRFSRNKYDSVIHKKKLRDNGVKVLSATEHITDDPTGQLMETIIEGFSQYYSDELSQKIKRGYRSNAEKCMVIGPPPLGYKRGQDGKYQIVPEEAVIVQEIFQRVATKEALVNIFRDLNARGIRTKKGGQWNRSSLNKILHSKKYIGVYEFQDTREGYEDIVIEGGVPRIIDDDLFYRVQEYCIDKPRSRGNPQKRRRESGVYLLTGKLYCGECKGAMVGVSGTGRHGELHFYYACKNRRDKKDSCPKKQVARDWIEEQIAAKIRELISQRDVIEWLADGLMGHLEELNETDETRLLRDRIAQIGKEKDNILKAIRAGTLEILLQELQKDYERLATEESSLKAKLLVEESKRKKDISREHVIAFAEEFAQGDIKDKRYQETLIDAFLVKAYLYDDRFKLVINFTGGANETEFPLEMEKDVESFEIQGLNTSGSSTEEVRISSPELHTSHLIRTQYTIFMIKGLAVLVAKLAGQR